MSLTSLKLAKKARLAVEQAQVWAHLSISPALELQACRATPNCFYLGAGDDLRSSCLSGKHFSY